MRKIFFTDMDETLLTSDKHISPKTLETLHTWISNGNILVFSSGRPLASVRDVIMEYDFDLNSVYAIGFNGSMTMHMGTGEVVIEKTLSLDLVRKIHALCKEHNIYVQSYDTENILSPNIGPEIQLYTRTVKLPVIELPNFPEGITAPPGKMLCIDAEDCGKLDSFQKILTKAFPDEITALKSHSYLLEIFNSQAGKGTAVRELCEYLDIPIKNSIAAGDQENDISMIQAAGLGIAMCNGKETVQAAADVVTKLDNNHDGLVEFLV